MARRPHVAQIVEGPLAARPSAAHTPAWIWYFAHDDGGGALHRPTADGWRRATPSVPGEWQTPDLLDGWQAGSPAPAFRLDGGSVEMRGLIHRSTGSLPSVAFVLPADFHPVAPAVFVVAVASGVVHLTVGDGGEVTVSDVTAGSSPDPDAGTRLDGVRFVR